MSHLSFDIDSNGDLYIKNNRLALVRDADALATVCTQVTSARRGEVLFFEDRGIPFFEQVWGGTPNLPQFEAAVISALTDIDGVVAVPQIIAAIQNDRIVYAAVVQTIYGGVTING